MLSKTFHSVMGGRYPPMAAMPYPLSASSSATASSSSSRSAAASTPHAQQARFPSAGTDVQREIKPMKPIMTAEEAFAALQITNDCCKAFVMLHVPYALVALQFHPSQHIWIHDLEALIEMRRVLATYFENYVPTSHRINVTTQDLLHEIRANPRKDAPNLPGTPGDIRSWSSEQILRAQETIRKEIEMLRGIDLSAYCKDSVLDIDKKRNAKRIADNLNLPLALCNIELEPDAETRNARRREAAREFSSRRQVLVPTDIYKPDTLIQRKAAPTFVGEAPIWFHDDALWNELIAIADETESARQAQAPPPNSDAMDASSASSVSSASAQASESSSTSAPAESASSTRGRRKPRQRKQPVSFDIG